MKEVSMDGPEGPLIGVAPWIVGCRMSFVGDVI